MSGPNDGRQPQRAHTLLPLPLAAVISLATATSSLGLRLGGIIGSTAIRAAREGSLTGLELGRVIFEGILTRAGHDVSTTASGDLGRICADRLLLDSLSTLHHSITSTAFLVSAGFQIGSTSLTSGIASAQLFLSALDAILGDTQTSRAVATIVTLAQREFRDPTTGMTHQKVSLWDILVGTTAFAILQRWGEKRTAQELEDAGVSHIVWDMVVISGDHEDTPGRMKLDDALDEGVDGRVAETPSVEFGRAASFISATGSGDVFQGLGDGRSFESMATASRSNLPPGADFSSLVFRQAISRQLAPGTQVSLTAESLVQDTVLIDVQSDDEIPHLVPPPGFALVSREILPWAGRRTRLTFRRRARDRRRASFSVEDAGTQDRDALSIHDVPDGTPISSLDKHPLPGNEDSMDVSAIPTCITPPAVEQDELMMDLVQAEEPVTANQKRPRSPLTRRSGYVTPPATPRNDNKPSAAWPEADRVEDVAQWNYTPMRTSMKDSKSVRKLVDFWSRGRPNRGHINARSICSPSEAFGFEDYNELDRTGTSNSSGGQESTPRSLTPLPTAAFLSEPADPSRHTRDRSSINFNVSLVSELVPYTYSQTDQDLRPLAARLYSDGALDRQFPPGHLVSNLARFARFSIASYGSTFLRLMSSWQSDVARPLTTDDLPEHHTFSSYIRLPASSVLLSSYTDPIGSRNAADDTEPGLPLVHFISIDHKSKAVVMTCRGTLGFEDVLTDLTGDYDDIIWRGTAHQVHRGILASARRLLTLHRGRVMATLKLALHEFPDYGLIFCGHSLGGAVAATLAILLAQVNTTSAGAAFTYVTAAGLGLPGNRPIHAFAYGPAACFSPSLQRATTGLITTVINGQDTVPYLSLGTLLDFQTMASSFASDSHNAKAEVVRRIKAGIYNAFRDRTGLGAFGAMFNSLDGTAGLAEEDHWPWIALQSLRASMLAPKLGPPGEVFTLESSPVLERHAFVGTSAKAKGSNASGSHDEARSYKPATRVKMTHVVNVERHFAEMKFGSGMFTDHFPGRYESVLAALSRGLGGED